MQNLDGFVHRRLVDHDRLEAPFERGIAFDVLAVFIQGGCADHLQFAARKRRFENVGGVHRGARRTSPDQHVHFIYKQDCPGGFQFVNNPLEALLELPAVHGTSNQRSNIQLQNALAEQRRGDVALDDTLRQPFDDSGLADPRFTDQGGVVLGTPRQNLDDPFDFHLASNNRVEFGFFCQ